MYTDSNATFLFDVSFLRVLFASTKKKLEKIPEFPFRIKNTHSFVIEIEVSVFVLGLREETRYQLWRFACNMTK